METQGKLNYLRIAPRKVRMVADMIRGRKASEAKGLLNFTLKRGARPVLKLLDSVMANAKNNLEIDKPEDLYIVKITVDEGPKLKRWRARARGRAMQIQKKTSHITLVLGSKVQEKDGNKEVKKAVVKTSPKKVSAKTKTKKTKK